MGTFARGLRGFLGVLFFVNWMAEGGSADQQIQADWMETVLQKTQTLRHYRGGVAYVDSVKGVHIWADSASVRVQDALYGFVAGVVYRDSSRHIHADRLVFVEEEQRAIFSGDVSFEDRARTLLAQRVTYDLKDDALFAEGPVRLELLDDGIALSAPRVQYEPAEEAIQAYGRSRITLRQPAGDSLVMASDSMSIALAPLVIDLYDDVELTAGRAVAHAKFVSLNDSSLVLWGHPRSQYSKGASDSLSMASREIRFAIRERQVEGIVLSDSVRLVSVSVQDSLHRTHRVEADSARIDVRGDSLRSLLATGGVASQFGDGEGNRADMIGQKMSVVYASGMLDSLVLSGEAKSTFLPPDSTSICRVTGDKHVVWFDKGGVERMEVTGQADCYYDPSEEGNVHLSGDRLRFIFWDGKPEHIAVVGGVQGVYREPGNP